MVQRYAIRIVLRNGAEFVLNLTPQELSLVEGYVRQRQSRHITENETRITFSPADVVLIQPLDNIPMEPQMDTSEAKPPASDEAEAKE